MSTSAIGSSSTTSTVTLQSQLKTDQTTLQQDEAKKAAAKTIDVDEAKVATDQEAINEAQDAKPGASSASSSSSSSATPASSAAGSVDVVA